MALAEHTINKLTELGAEVEIYSIRAKDHKPCIGCMACMKLKECRIKDDMKDLHQKMKEADGIIFASPIYFYDVNAQCKIIIDRSYAVSPLNGNKVGASLFSAGSLGHSGALKTIETFFSVHGISNVGNVCIYNIKEDMPIAEKSARDLGEKMYKAVEFMKTCDFEPFAQHNHYAYGTHTF
jgi:multimeric flavodoxin WrbA